MKHKFRIYSILTNIFGFFFCSFLWYFKKLNISYYGNCSFDSRHDDGFPVSRSEETLTHGSMRSSAWIPVHRIVIAIVESLVRKKKVFYYHGVCLSHGSLEKTENNGS